MPEKKEGRLNVRRCETAGMRKEAGAATKLSMSPGPFR